MDKFIRWVKNIFDPYYEMSADEIERLIVVRSHYQSALWSLEDARADLQAQINYLTPVRVKQSSVNHALYTKKAF